MTYTDMTDEEYDALDEKLTCSTPKFGPPGSDWLAQRDSRQTGLSKRAMDWLLAKADAEHKPFAQVIDELVQEKIASAEA
jgi:hypothetical protein